VLDDPLLLDPLEPDEPELLEPLDPLDPLDRDPPSEPLVVPDDVPRV